MGARAIKKVPADIGQLANILYSILNLLILSLTVKFFGINPESSNSLGPKLSFQSNKTFSIQGRPKERKEEKKKCIGQSESDGVSSY